MHFKNGTSDRGQVVSIIGHFVIVMYVNNKQTCLEIKGLTEFWFNIYASKNSAYQSFIFHHLKIQRPGDKATCTCTKAWGQDYMHMYIALTKFSELGYAPSSCNVLQ